MEAILLCLLPNEMHLLSRRQGRFILIQIVPLHVYYMFRPVLGPCLVQKSYKKDVIKSKGRLVVYSHIFCNVKVKQRLLKFNFIFLYKVFVLPCLGMA
jgi:hypothetical protein